MDWIEIFFLKLRASTQKTGIQELKDGPQLSNIVFYRRPCEGNSVIGFQCTRGSSLFCFCIFDVLSFIQNHAAPNHLSKRGTVPKQQRITGNNDIKLRNLGCKRGSFLPVAS